MKKKRPDSPAKHYAIATILNSIGNCYQDLGEYQKALDEFYQKARKHLQGAEDDQATKKLNSMLYNNEGICHDALGHYDKALEAYDNDLSIQKEINASAEDLAMTLNNMGKVLSAQGRHEEALEKYKESLEKYREHSGQDANTVGIAMSLNNIGREYRLLKDYVSRSWQMASRGLGYETKCSSWQSSYHHMHIHQIFGMWMIEYKIFMKTKKNVL